MKRILQIISAFMVLLFIQFLLKSFQPIHNTGYINDSPAFHQDECLFWVFNDKG